MSSPKTFIFDFDSTIFPGETLDEIIQYQLKDDPNKIEKSQAIHEICNQGMSGDISMELSLKKRLDIAAPNRHTIKQFVQDQVQRISSPIRELLKGLYQNNYMVFVVSGGFEEWIQPMLSDILPKECIHANRILNPHISMTYDNINIRSKEEIITALNIDPHTALIIGDGATDFNVFKQGLVQQFIGTFFYTGILNREKVISKVKKNDQIYFDDLNEFVQYMKRFLA